MNLDMPDISSRDFGRLEADVRNLNELLKSIDKKMDGVVTRVEFNDAIKGITTSQLAQEERLDALERVNALRSQSIWSRIGTAADASFVSFVGKAIFILFGVLFATYFLSNYHVAPKHDEPITIKGVENG